MRFLRFLALARLLRGGRRRGDHRSRHSPYGYGGGFGRRRHPQHRQVRVVGCAPGCLMTSLLLSIGVTILLNVVIRLF